ncbi:hypothetical protein SEVIR_2G200350v4 [Setaria viridis]
MSAATCAGRCGVLELAVRGGPQTPRPFCPSAFCLLLRFRPVRITHDATRATTIRPGDFWIGRVVRMHGSVEQEQMRRHGTAADRRSRARARRAGKEGFASSGFDLSFFIRSL